MTVCRIRLVDHLVLKSISIGSHSANMKCFVVSLLLLVAIAELVSARYGGYERRISSSQDTDNNHDPGYLSIEDTEKRDSQGFGNPGWGGGGGY